MDTCPNIAHVLLPNLGLGHWTTCFILKREDVIYLLARVAILDYGLVPSLLVFGLSVPYTAFRSRYIIMRLAGNKCLT